MIRVTKSPIYQLLCLKTTKELHLLILEAKLGYMKKNKRFRIYPFGPKHI